MDQQNVAILGYSGHAFVVLDACKKSGILVTGYCDRLENTSNNIYNLEYLGCESDDKFNWNTNNTFVLGIGDNKIRAKVAMLLEQHQKSILKVIHPSAIINDFVSIGDGTFVASNVTINPLVKIGNCCIINTGAIIEHECSIGDASHIAPGATLAGNVTIGSQTFIGANSVVKQGISIGENVTLGAGSVVIKDIPSGETWVGNPARSIFK